MLILIVKDEHTQIPKEVVSIEEARGFVEQGLAVFRIGDAGEKLPLEEDSPDAQASDEPEEAPKATKKRAATKKA